MRAFSQERSLVQNKQTKLGSFLKKLLCTQIGADFFYLFIFYVNFQRFVCIEHYPGRVPKAQEQTAHACILARTLTGI